jgi:flagellar protein FlaG
MEIQNTMPKVTAASVSGTEGQVLPAGGKATVQSVEIKAPPKVPEFEPKDLDKAVQDLQAYVDGLGRDLSFRRDESIDRSIITVRDSSTNQVVRQIPGEEVIAISRQIKEDLNELRAGMLMKGEV